MKSSICRIPGTNTEIIIFYISINTFNGFAYFIDSAIGISEQQDIFIRLIDNMRHKIFKHDTRLSSSRRTPEQKVFSSIDHFFKNPLLLLSKFFDFLYRQLLRMVWWSLRKKQFLFTISELHKLKQGSIHRCEALYH